MKNKGRRSLKEIVDSTDRSFVKAVTQFEERLEILDAALCMQPRPPRVGPLLFIFVRICSFRPRNEVRPFSKSSSLRITRIKRLPSDENRMDKLDDDVSYLEREKERKKDLLLKLLSILMRRE